MTGHGVPEAGFWGGPRWRLGVRTPPGELRSAPRRRRTALLAALGAACAAPAGSVRLTSGPAERLYVADALGDTVAQLDAASGRRVGPPLPA